ncbi:AAA family ATPase [bacterium]|nr:AAA family ATPase [bacterium]
MSSSGRVLDPVTISLDGVHSIEASAGTGKTYTITTLYLRYLLELEQPVDRILVTTFTDAATAELRSRLRERITAARNLVAAFDDGDAAVAGSDDGQLLAILDRCGAWQTGSREKLIDRLEAALLSFDQAPVFTIHGFCNRVLQELVFETGTRFNVELVSSVDDLIDECVHDFVARHWCGNDPHLSRWLRLDQSLLESLSKAAREAAENPSYRIVPESKCDDQDSRPDQTQRRSGSISKQNADANELLPERRCAWSGLLDDPVVSQADDLLDEVATLWADAKTEIRESLFDARDAGLLNKSWHGKPGQIEQGIEFLDALVRTRATALFTIKLKDGECEVPTDQRRLSQEYLERSAKAGKKELTPRHRVFEIVDELLALAPAIERLRTELQRELLASVARETRRNVDRQKRERGIMSFGDLLHQVDAALDGPQGELLLGQLRERYHVALVDEFQDTDPVQFRIFSRVFHEAATVDAGLGESARAFVMIGDPKQSIYRFRGADLQAYLQAARQTPVDNRHSMGTNWRTDRSLVDAVQRIFETSGDPFLDDEITVPPVGARFDDRLAEQSALIVTLIPRPDDVDDGKPRSKDDALDAAARRVAADIAAQLGSRQPIPQKNGSLRPVRASDIAVLARNGFHLRAVQAALRDLRIPSVLQTDDSVYSSDEAEALCHVLRAVLLPGSPTLLANALQTPVFGKTASQLAELAHDADQLADYSERFRDWHLTWHRDGVMVMWRRLLDDQNTIVRLAGLISGERQITNLLHLGELLHRYAAENHAGPDALLRWFESQVNDPQPRDDEAQLRLETDADAVQLCTIHKSKGLEWPIVYCPTLWAYRDPDWRRPNVLLSRAGAGDSTLEIPEIDVGSELLDDRIAKNISQEFAEERRLLYVALTRARHQCHLHWIAARDAFRSALGQIIAEGHSPTGKESDDEIETLLQRWLRRLNVPRTELRGVDFEVPNVVDSGSDGGRVTKSIAHWSRRPITRRTIDAAAQTSFTALSRSFDAAGSGGPADRDAEPAGRLATELLTVNNDSELPLARMPGGVDIGSLVHDVFESVLTAGWDSIRCDSALVDHVENRLAEQMPRVQLDDRWRTPLAAAMTRCLTQPLADMDGSLRLIDVPRRKLACELPFVLSCGDWALTSSRGGQSGSGFRTEALANALTDGGAHGDAAFGAMLSEYAPRVRLMNAPLARGFLSGFVDLIVEHDGRWYLIDYKTNQLGPNVEHFGLPALREAMIEHDYLLQLLLYCVALQRHLKRRLPGFNWERDFGGVLYLFVRGFAENAPAESGIFAARPDAALIDRLSRVLSREVV